MIFESLNRRESDASPLALKEFFRRGDTWNKGVLPRQQILIKLFHSQQDLGFVESLSLSFNEEQTAHTKEFEVYEDWHEMRSFIKQVLQNDDDGWVPLEHDSTEIKSRNRLLFDYGASKPGLNKTSDQVRHLWSFPLNM